MANRDGKGDFAHSPRLSQGSDQYPASAQRRVSPFEICPRQIPPPPTEPPASPSLETQDPNLDPPTSRLRAGRSVSSLNKVALRCRLGEMIRNERKRQALSQEELAFRAKLHPAQVSLAECGSRDIRFTTICAFAAALRVE